jgi:HAD superfamily hydrolase (TIGR01509 family)
MSLKALIFDVDGTLADTARHGHRVAFNAAFADAGLPWHWSEECYGELLSVAGGKERIRHYVRRFQPGFPNDRLDALIPRLHRLKTQHYLEMLKVGLIPLRRGVLRLLREAREAGVRLAVATTTTPANVSALLESVPQPGLETWFEVIAAGDCVPSKKPAPDIYRHVLAELRLPASDCVVLEDSEIGVRAAVAAGLDVVVATVNPYTRDQDLSGAALVVDALGDTDSPAQVLAGTLNGDAVVGLETLRRLRECTLPPVPSLGPGTAPGADGLECDRRPR